MDSVWVWIFPVVGAAIGYLTNWIAVQMLLRPRLPVRFLGMTWIGLIPRRRKEIASAVAEIVSTRLLRKEDVARMVTKGKMGRALRTTLDSEIDSFTTHILGGFPDAVRRIVPDALVEALRLKVQKEVHNKLSEIACRAADTLDGTDIKDIVEDRINALDQLEMENVTLKIARRELRGIEILGGILGCLIGFVQLGVVVASR